MLLYSRSGMGVNPTVSPLAQSGRPGARWQCTCVHRLCVAIIDILATRCKLTGTYFACSLLPISWHSNIDV